MKLLLILFTFSCLANEFKPKKNLKVTKSTEQDFFIFVEQEFAEVFINNERNSYSQSNIFFRKSYDKFSISFNYGKSFLNNKDHFSNQAGIIFSYSHYKLGKVIKDIYYLSNKYRVSKNYLYRKNNFKHKRKIIKNNSLVYSIGFTEDTYVSVFDKGTYALSTQVSLGYEFHMNQFKGQLGYKYTNNELYNMNKIYFSIGF